MPDGKPDVQALEERLANFMRMHRRTMHQYFQSIGMFNGHPHLLFLIHHQPGITQTELSRRTDLSAATVAISVRRLELAGLLRKESDPKDGRITHLHLTPAGEEVDAACRRGRDYMVETVYAGLTPEEIETMYTLLGKMSANLQAASDALPPCDQEKG